MRQAALQPAASTRLTMHKTKTSVGGEQMEKGERNKALFSSRNEKFSATVALSFVCGKYYLIMD